MPSPTGKDPAAHMLYIRDELPEVYERTYKFLNVPDYLNFRLCGRMAASYDSIMTTWVTDNRDADAVRYDPSLVRDCGIDGDKLPEIVKCTEVLGRLTGQPAEVSLEPPVDFHTGPRLLRDHARALLGPEPAGRHVRIMVTMPSDAATNPVIAAAAADPQRYVQQYSTTTDRYLKVGFDARGMEDLLQKAGLPLWPSERPVTMVALFLPSVAGGSRAVLASEHPPERAEIEKAALYRGVPITWPAQPLGPAAARSRPADENARAVLVGEGAGPTLNWSFASAGQASSGQGGPAAGIDLAADAGGATDFTWQP
jgi:hypothetical protein